MDPITIGSLLGVAVGALASEAVKDLYNAIKNRIKAIVGEDDDVLEALEDVEEKPKSTVRRETLEKKLEATDVAQDKALVKQLGQLAEILNREGFLTTTNFSATQKGSGAIAQGKKAMAAGKGGVVGKKVKKSQIATGKQSRNIKTKVYIEKANLTSPGSAKDPIQTTKQRYLERLINEFHLLPLAALGGGDELKGEVTLDQVYIDLNTQTPQEAQTGTGQRTVRARAKDPNLPTEHEVYTARQIAARTKKLLLLGGPGSGKSTFAKELCAKIAGAQLKKKKPLNGWIEHPLPLFLVLRHVVLDLNKLDVTSLTVEQREQSLADIMDQAWRMQFAQDQESGGQVLDEALSSGNVLLVFDGLDEVPLGQRPRVHQAVMSVVARYPKLKHIIVTCRSRSYSGPDMLPGFSPHRLAPFDEEKIRQFVQAWYNAQGELDEATRQARIDDLCAVALGPLAELSENPMLLTTMAVLHRKGAGLPKERVKLYDLAVNVMLQRWEKEKGSAESRPIAHILEDERQLRELMEYIAHRIHEIEAGGMDGAQENQSGTDRYALLKILEKHRLLGDLAGPFLDYVDQRAGILIGEGGGEGGIPQTYRFPHRTFQEYLAGCFMVKGRSIHREHRRRAGEGDFWSVAAQLGAEELWFNRRDDKILLDLAYELCPETSARDESQWRSILWVGTVAVLVGVEWFEEDSDHPRGGKQFVDFLKDRLVQIMRASPLPAIERAEAGRHLGKLGDQRVEVLAPQKTEFIEIPDGPFKMGEKGETITITVPYTYYISKFPVTQAQFQAFVDDNGYQHEAYWPEAKSAGVWQAGMVQGRYDDQPREKPEDFGEPFNFPNHPVVGVTWYEALAYCRWLTQKLCEWEGTPGPLRTLLRTGGETGKPWSITLPNEPEWEKAARGDKDDRTYPWGDNGDPDLANYLDTQINATSAVGCFSKGASPFKVEEMSGNVWEWTRSVYEDKPYSNKPGEWGQREDVLATENQDRVLRGGSWYNDGHYMRCAFRSRLGPDDGDDSVGFRVVASPFSDL